MDRRRFLRGVSAAACMSAAGSVVRTAFAADDILPAGKINRVAVIGAGIVGASIAYNLSKRGCDVILLDKTGPAAQASGNSFAWINATYYDMPRSYFTLRSHSLNEYHRLSQDVDIPIHWGGSLEWYDSAEREQEVSDGVLRIQGYGAPTWMVDKKRVKELEPNLDTGSDRMVAWSSREGAVHPGDTTRALVNRTLDYGGTAVFPTTVTALRESAAGWLVETDVETFEVDLVVIATGIHANEVTAMAGLDTNLVKPATPGIIVTTKPMKKLLNAVAYTTDSHFHQLSDGRVILGEKAGPLETDQHFAYLNDHPNAYPSTELALEHAKRVIDTAAKYVPQFTGAEIENVGVGWRPLPLDGLPTIGRPKSMPGIYLASMHSGVTLAPIVGHLAAMEILDGVSVDLLSDFRVARF
jgi:glycine/D-amino acid oxidase-like deaminating enzyme